MINHTHGDIFATDCVALVNTVNCVGVMGAGIALGVKQRWPAIFSAYRLDCRAGIDCAGQPDPRIGPQRHQRAPDCCRPGGSCAIHQVRPGHVIIRPTNQQPVRFVFDFPTKRHWADKSEIEDIEAGLPALADAIRASFVPSIAIPPLGCGNGGLQWTAVRPLIEAALRSLADIRIDLCGPATPHS